MGYNTNYDPVSGAPFEFGGFVHHKPYDHRTKPLPFATPKDTSWVSWLGSTTRNNSLHNASILPEPTQSLDSEWYVYTYQPKQHKYVLEIPSLLNTRLTAVPKSLPVSKTQPYQWIENEPYVLLLPCGSLIKRGVTSIDSGIATVTHSTTGSIEYSITTWEKLEAIPFYRCVWNQVLLFATSRGYSSAEIFRSMAPTIDTYVSYMNQDCYYTFDPVFENTKYFVEYLPNLGSQYKHPLHCRAEHRRILQRLDRMFPKTLCNDVSSHVPTVCSASRCNKKPPHRAPCKCTVSRKQNVSGKPSRKLSHKLSRKPYLDTKRSNRLVV